MNGSITIIDGISNSGKTSFCHYLFKFGYVVIDEVPLFIKNNNDKFDNISSTIPKTIEEERKNQEILYHAEIERLKFAVKSVNQGKKVIMDRSFLSTVAMAYALEKDLPFKGAYEFSKKLEKEYLAKLVDISKNIDIYLLFFDVNRSILEKRNNLRERPLNHEWIDEHFLEKQRISFIASASALHSKIIDTSYLSLSELKQILCDVNYKRKI